MGTIILPLLQGVLTALHDGQKLRTLNVSCGLSRLLLQSRLPTQPELCLHRVRGGSGNCFRSENPYEDVCSDRD